VYFALDTPSACCGEFHYPYNKINYIQKLKNEQVIKGKIKISIRAIINFFVLLIFETL